MASWCIEAAIALRQIGEELLLIKSEDTEVPEILSAVTLNFNINQDNNTKVRFIKKLFGKIKKYYQLIPFVSVENKFLERLNYYLNEKHIKPTCYLLNQTSFVNNSVDVSQYVVGWSYKPSLTGYLKKVLITSADFTTFKDNTYNAFFWYKIDWKGYKKASGVLCISNKLTSYLKAYNINAVTVYPGVDKSIPTLVEKSKSKCKIRFVFAAIDLSDKRKGLKKIIKCLKSLDVNKFEIVLIGNCPEKFKNWILLNSFPARFTGLLDRENVLKEMNNCDVLLFGSVVDDWGFVQVEAMSNGLTVLSPNISPFDEIISRSDYLYELKNNEDLYHRLNYILNQNNIDEDKQWFKKRFQEKFSSKQFGVALLNAISYLFISNNSNE